MLARSINHSQRQDISASEISFQIAPPADIDWQRPFPALLPNIHSLLWSLRCTEKKNRYASRTPKLTPRSNAYKDQCLLWLLFAVQNAAGLLCGIAKLRFNRRGKKGVGRMYRATKVPILVEEIRPETFARVVLRSQDMAHDQVILLFQLRVLSNEFV